MRFGWRHPVVFIVRENAADELALVRVARLDDGPPFAHVLQLFQHAFAHIQAELRFPLAGVRSVTAEASIRQQRADLIAEIDAGGLC
jgi:hypothetical protein